MWGALAKAVLGFVGGPALAGLVDMYKAKLAAGNDAARIAADLAAKELELERRERELADRRNDADEGRWWTAAPRAVVCWSFALYVVYMVVWVGMFHLGVAFELKGNLGQWAGWLMALWFGGRSAEKIARIFRK
ncbi:hypothetical protein ACQR1H_03255 [Bradyrhizobium sp. HKCCYLRH2015]|uniref:hypothetical protein n=1 Tax=Bradyrhizobium sp. HKCCYLRH2015 TaxID=3420742 RepID=UPI003EBA731E